MFQIDLDQLSEHDLVSFIDISLPFIDQPLLLRCQRLRVLLFKALLADSHTIATLRARDASEELNGWLHLNQPLVMLGLLSDFYPVVAESASDKVHWVNPSVAAAVHLYYNDN